MLHLFILLPKPPAMHSPPQAARGWPLHVCGPYSIHNDFLYLPASALPLLFYFFGIRLLIRQYFINLPKSPSLVPIYRLSPLSL